MALFSPLLLLCAFFIYLVFPLLSRHHRLHLSPGDGPKSFPVIGCLISFYRNRRRLLDWYTDLLAASPSQTIVVRRLGSRRTVVTSNPKNIEHILKTNFCNYPKGKPFTVILGDLLGMGIFNVDGEQWYAQRKLVSHDFTAKSLRELVLKAIEIEARDRLIPAIDLAESSGGELDLQEILREFAFNIICKVSLGTDSDFVPGLSRSFDAAAAIIARRGAASLPATWKVKRYFSVGDERLLREEIGHIHRSIMKLIKSRKEELSKEEVKKSDFLTRLIVCGHDDEMICDMVISFIMAGRDTTSSALTWFFWLLSCHRDVESELLDEIMLTEEIFDFENLKKMELLKASLCESMRLYPPVAWDSKHAVSDDVLPDGTEIKKGDRVTYFPYGVGRMTAVWGEDCLEFKPKRWLTTAEKTAAVSPFKFPVFQAGPRVCLGKEMAFLQMKCVTAAILRRFVITPVDSGRRPVFVPLLTAHMANGFNITVKKRKRVSGDYTNK